MMISNGMMRNAPEVEKTELKIKDENTTQAQSCENNVEIHKDSETLGLSSLITALSAFMLPTATTYDVKELKECYHELDKRIAVVEALLHHSK